MCQNLDTFSDSLVCKKNVHSLGGTRLAAVLGGDPLGEGGGAGVTVGRKPDCAQMNCAECGFGKDGGIPECSAWEEFGDHPVWWVQVGDRDQEDGTTTTTMVGRKQQIPVNGSVKQLWSDFKAHSVKVN